MTDNNKDDYFFSPRVSLTACLLSVSISNVVKTPKKKWHMKCRHVWGSPLTLHESPSCSRRPPPQLHQVTPARGRFKQLPFDSHVSTLTREKIVKLWLLNAGRCVSGTFGNDGVSPQRPRNEPFHMGLLYFFFFSFMRIKKHNYTWLCFGLFLKKKCN